jgi:hypothetical protein
MKGVRSRLLIVLSLAGLAGCATYPDRYIAAGPGGVDCRYERCLRDGYTYWSDGYEPWRRYDGGYGAGAVWYGSSRWYAPYRPGYTAWGFRDPWFDPWYDPWWGTGWAWTPARHAGWRDSHRSHWSWSIGYGWSSGPWSGSLWYRPWWQPVWYGSGWHGGGWTSTWHRPYRGHRPPPRERTVDWRPAEGLGVANPRWLPAAEEAQRIADRARAGAPRSWMGSAAPAEERIGSSDAFERGDVEPMRLVEPEDPVRLDRRPGRLMPRGAAEGWIAPMPGSRPPGRERGSDDGVRIEAARPARWDPMPSRFETPEPIGDERPMPGRFARGEPGRFDPSPSRFETPEEPVGYERPMPGRFARPEPARFDPPPPRFEAPEPIRYERPMPEAFEPVRADPAPRFEPPQHSEAPAEPETRLDPRRFDRADFEPR